MGFSIVYKKLIFKGIKKALRIICIMLILENLNFLMRQNPKIQPKVGLFKDLVRRRFDWKIDN
jgi:hypothetical protein